MPRLFTFSCFAERSEVVRTYADKHTPVIICASEAKRNQDFTVKVRIGTAAKHPNTPLHHFVYIQLWNLETLVGETRLDTAALGNEPLQIEALFTVQPAVSMRLTAIAYCNKHGLWKSEEHFVKVSD